MPGKTKSRNSKKTFGGEDSSVLPSISDVSKIQGLDFNSKKFPEFNYDKYLDQVRLSNFTKGGGLKKVLKEAYSSYMQGGYSHIKALKMSQKKQKGGENDFPVSDSQLRNVKDLQFGTPYEIPKLQRIPKAPYSNFGL